MADVKPPVSSLERRALSEYVDLASRVPKVAFIFAEKEPDLHVYVGLERRLLRSCERLYEIQDRIRDEFEGLRADFHIIYVNGSPAGEFMGETARLIVDWRANVKGGGDPPLNGPIKVIYVPRPIEAPDFGTPIKPQTRSHSRVNSRDA